MIVLRRPGAAEINEADAYIFGLVRQASADRKTAPWTFHLVGGLCRHTQRHAVRRVQLSVRVGAGVTACGTDREPRQIGLPGDAVPLAQFGVRQAVVA